MRVKGQSVLITGAGNGIGEGIAKRLAEEGAVVTINDIDAQRADRVCQEIKARGGQAWLRRRAKHCQTEVLQLAQGFIGAESALRRVPSLQI